MSEIPILYPNPELKTRVVNPNHELQKFKKDIETVKQNYYIVKRGDTLHSVFYEKLGMTNYLGAYSRIIKTNYSDGHAEYEHTVSDFKEIEVGDEIYMKDGVIMIKRSPLIKYTYVVKNDNQHIYNIIKNKLNLNFKTKDYLHTEKILFLIKQEGTEVKKDLMDGYVSDYLQKGDILTVKFVNGIWQYIIERPVKDDFDIDVPTLSEQKKKKPKEQKLVELIEIDKTQRKDPLTNTIIYAKNRIRGLPQNKKQEFLTELKRRLESLDKKIFSTRKQLDQAYTKIRIEYGRDFFPKLSGEEFEEFYRNTGVGPKAFGVIIANLLGRKLSKAKPNIKPKNGKFASNEEIKDFIDKKYGKFIKNNAGENIVLFKALMKRESKGDFLAVSGSGALGAMQLMPSNCISSYDFPNPINPFNEKEAILRGISLYNKILKRNKRNIGNDVYKKTDKIALVLACYNWGETNVRRLLNNPKKIFPDDLPGETKKYIIMIKKHMKAWNTSNIMLAQK